MIFTASQSHDDMKQFKLKVVFLGCLLPDYVQTLYHREVHGLEHAYNAMLSFGAYPREIVRRRSFQPNFSQENTSLCHCDTPVKCSMASFVHVSCILHLYYISTHFI